jgi:hypothetical protein
LKKKRIANQWYKIPQTLKDVNLRQYIKFYGFNKERLELLSKIEEATSVHEQNILHLLQSDVFDNMLSAISNIPYLILAKMDLVEKGKIYSLFDPIIQVIDFNPNLKQQCTQFKFGKKTFYLFEFGIMTAKQMLWFETYWKQLYQQVTKEVTEAHFEQLAKLIAITAFQKNEINTWISNGQELPYEIKEDYYEDFSKLVDERTELFQDLSLDTVYRCLNFFLSIRSLYYRLLRPLFWKVRH